MINPMNFLILSSDELIIFSKEVLTIMDAKKVKTPALMQFIHKTSQMLVLFQGALEREKKNPFALLSIEKEAARDSAYIGFCLFLDAASHRTTAGWSVASSIILEVIRRNNWSNTTLGYKADSAVLTNIILEIRSKCNTELAHIGGTDWLDELDAAQIAFNTASHQKVKTTYYDEPTICKIRPQLTTSLKSLFSMISVLQLDAPIPDFATIETALNELIISSLTCINITGPRAETRKKSMVSTAG